ncbi:acid-sensing ion channel 1C [Trichonephila inaurata madagascariensis]|uniref:Acid-sensing ion channel 1C n=1 Tax=Trichonephila inaurata madagascariensis TaxID=2747483 RepID=A0A8X7BY88_9ARAC|nr:acid-sensing ion channel 1C [Trichonephila inaurata madagascariensis]
MYWQYPVVVNLIVEEKSSLQFPAVSVCNLNRMINNDTQCEDNRPRINDGVSLVFSELSSLSNCKKTENGTTELNEKNNGALKFLMEYYKLGENERSRLGHDRNRFLDGCLFNGRTCSKVLLENFSNYRYGSCITFNKRIHGVEPLRISETGFSSGLVLKLNIEACYYLPSTHTQGVRVVIHNPEDIPKPEEDGFNVSPGYETTVSLRQKIIRRLPSPYKDRCVDFKAKTNGTVNNKIECIRTCIQEYNFAKCRCTDPTLAVMKHLRPCDFMNATQACCLDDVLIAMARNSTMCKCPLPCESIYYDEKLSTARLPSETLFIDEKTDLSAIFKDMRFRYESVRLNVFYSSLERHVYEQRAKFQPSELFSYLGNELALWLGLSLVAIAELTEKLVISIKYLVI